MKPWERKLYDWGLLGYLVRDVIGAHQEESFGIRQNHSMGLKEWHALSSQTFRGCRIRSFRARARLGRAHHQRAIGCSADWRAARLLGGTLAAVCRKAGDPAPVSFDPDRFETQLRCPDCHGPLRRAF